MSRLNNNSTPAERKRSCIFAETFETQAKVEDNEGSVTGSPTIDNGAVIDCSNGDEIVNTSQLHIGITSFSILCKIKFSSVSQYDMFFSKRNSSDEGVRFDAREADGRVRFLVEDSSSNVEYVLSTSQYDDDEWHSFLLTVDRDNDEIGMSIDGTTTETAVNISSVDDISTTNNLLFGDAADTHSFEIKDFRLFNGYVLTNEELDDYHNNSTYDYMEDAVAHYPLKTAQHDAGNSKTEDISGNDYDLSFASVPTKLTDRGYSFTTNDALTHTGFLSDGETELTFAVMVRTDNNDANQACISCYGGGGGVDIQTDTSDDSGYLIVCGDGSDFARVDTGVNTGLHIFTLCYDGGKTGNSGRMKVYVDGEEATLSFGGSASIPASIDLNGLDFALGKMTSIGRFWEGDILAGAVWRKALTPMQINDLTQRWIKQVNDT